jgi:uncharacterized protein YcfJ
MNKLGKTVGRKTAKKTAKATARHSVRGLKSKARRDPLRTSTLLGAGGAIGAVVGFVLGRRTGSTRPT